MSMTRRVFLQNSAMALAGTAAIPSFLPPAAFANTSTKNGCLVVIFQRGGADGLNIVVPHGEAAYYRMRPSINIPRDAVIDLDGFFGLHPAIASLHPLWKRKHLAIVHAVGSHGAPRLHIAAQDLLESGVSGGNASTGGWLNRAVTVLPSSRNESAFRVVGLGPTIPRILTGKQPALALNSAKGLEAPVHGTPTPRRGANYPESRFGDDLKQLARIIKAKLGMQVAFVDVGGWDHHVNEGGTQGQIADILQEFSQALSAFWIDLGDSAEHTVVVTLSEFGRSARENYNRGTDHGHGNVMFILGGPVKGGKVYGRWPGLDQFQLHQGRDLAVTTDFRSVVGEIVGQHLDNKSADECFPGFDNRAERLLNFLHST